MPRKLSRRGGHIIRGTRTLCGKPAPTGTPQRVDCFTCNLIISATPHLNGK